MLSVFGCEGCDDDCLLVWIGPETKEGGASVSLSVLGTLELMIG